MSEAPATVAQHTLSLLRKTDTKLEDVVLRRAMLERRSASNDEGGVFDRRSVVGSRQRIERRLERTS